MSNELTLTLQTESRVIATNMDVFEKNAKTYLATFNNNFETDEDFATAKEQVKTLKKVETDINERVEQILNGNLEVAAVIKKAQDIAEMFRQERLQRERLIKERDIEIKKGLLVSAYESLRMIINAYESDVSIALELVLSKQTIKDRLQQSIKRRTTLKTLKAALDAETTAIATELATTLAGIATRRKMIPLGKDHLFTDWQSLTATSTNEQMQQVVAERLADEQARINLEAEKERLKNQQEQPPVFVQQPNLVNPGPKPQQPVKAEPAKVDPAKVEPGAEEKEWFHVSIGFQGTIEEAKAYFAPLRDMGFIKGFKRGQAK